MNWITVYITGKSDFREDVRKKLEHSDLNFMPGYIAGSHGNLTHDLIWLDETTDLRKLKEAIGSKLIWKHRLRFYDSLEAFIEAQNPKGKKTEWTPEEISILEAMRNL
jgi:hypothetical protein